MKMNVLVLLALVLLTSSSHGESVFDKVGAMLDNAIDSAKEKVGDSFAGQFVLGAVDMKRAYDDMIDANWKESDKYFHARGNHEAAKRGPGGELAAEVISDLREMTQLHHREDSEADQAANRWGREGGDPNKYRPQGLPDKY